MYLPRQRLLLNLVQPVHLSETYFYRKMMLPLFLLNAIFLSMSVVTADPRFDAISASLFCSTRNLGVCWEEIGLESNALVKYEIESDAIVEFQCQKGGSIPPGLQTTSFKIRNKTEAVSTSDGKVSDMCIYLFGSDTHKPACPSPFTPQVSITRYNQIFLTDTTNHVVYDIGNWVCN